MEIDNEELLVGDLLVLKLGEIYQMMKFLYRPII